MMPEWKHAAVELTHCPSCGTALCDIKLRPSWQTHLSTSLERACDKDTRLHRRERDSHFVISYESKMAAHLTYVIFKNKNSYLSEYEWRYIYIASPTNKSLTLETKNQRWYVDYWYRPKDTTLYSRPIDFSKKLAALNNLE